jgi:hypothetical protein
VGHKYHDIKVHVVQDVLLCWLIHHTRPVQDITKHPVIAGLELFETAASVLTFLVTWFLKAIQTNTTPINNDVGLVG